MLKVSCQNDLIDWGNMNILQSCSIPTEYSILFLESSPPGPESLAKLNPSHIEQSDDGEWRVKFDSLKGCEVLILCDADPSVDLRGETQFSPGLSDKEKERIGCSKSRWHVMIDPGTGPLLKTRKSILIALGQLLKADRTSVGVYAVDSFRVWPISAIADELKTKADVDIDSLYITHAVLSPDGSKWIHTHGLAALGGFDIDFINPSDEMYDSMNALIRAMVFAILEGGLGNDDPMHYIAEPGGLIRTVPVEKFEQVAKTKFREIRGSDAAHVADRSVVCEPRKGKKLFGLLKEVVEPSKFVRFGSSDNLVFAYSKTTSDILAQRAQETYPILVKAMQEFESLGLPVMVKVACPVDSGEGDEHIWFSVHNADQNGIDATCINQPYDVPNLHEGDRGRYGVGQITEWNMQTPLGTLSPSELGMIRTIKANREEIGRLMQEYGKK